MKQKLLAYLMSLVCIFAYVCPAVADYSLLQITGHPYNPTGPYLVLSGLSGQGACSVSLTGTTTGTWAVEGLYQGSQAWTPALTVVSPDGLNPSTAITAAGGYAFNCANMIAIRLDGTAGTGTPYTVLSAGGGVNRVLSSGVNGGRTNVVGTAPIVVTNAGNTATVSLTTPLTIAQGGTGATALASGCLASNGTVVVSQACPTPAPVVTPVSVQAGTGIAVATPSPGVFVVSNTGVTSVTGTGNMAVTAGPTPNVTITNAPTFTGNVSAGSVTAANLTSNDCLRSVSGLIQSASTDCPNGAIGALTAGTGIAISTPNPNKPTVSLITPVAVVNGGRGNTVATAGQCEDAASSSVIETSNCAQWAVQSFVAPAIGATVTITSNENKLFTAKKYTPIFVSDGTTAVQGYVNATVTNSTTVVLFETNIDVGSVGATLAVNSLLSLSGLGISGLSGITAGNDIVVTPTNPSKPTVAVTQSPTFTGNVTAGTLTDSGLSAGICVGTTTAGLLSNGIAPFTTGGCGVNSVTTGTAVLPSVGGQFSISISPDIYPYYGEMAYFINPPNTCNFIAQRVSAFPGSGVGTFQVVAINVTCPSSTIPVGTNVYIGGIQYGLGSSLSLTSPNASPVLSVNPNLSLTTLTATSLTANQCVKADSGKTLVSSGSCPVVYASGTLLTGMHIETTTFVATTLSSTTFTFATPYNTAPICTGNVENAGAGGLAVSFDGVPTTTSAIVKNNITGTVNIGVMCVGF